MPGGDKIGKLVKSGSPNSTALILRQAINDSDGLDQHLWDSLDFPDHRKAMYTGHSLMNKRKFFEVVGQFRNAQAYENDYVKTVAGSYQFKALFCMNDMKEALALVVDHCLGTPSAYKLYPLEQLAEKAINDFTTKRSRDLTILLHIMSKKIHPKWERSLSDIFENFMLENNIAIPHDVSKLVANFGLKKVVYALRYVCVPRFLDDTTFFSSLEEIESERIAICRILISLDDSNSEVYSSEIRAIVRYMKISESFNKVEASKIYLEIRNSTQRPWDGVSG